jgi:hypothetical protein
MDADLNPLLGKEGKGEVMAILPIPLLTSPCKGEACNVQLTEYLPSLTDYG